VWQGKGEPLVALPQGVSLAEWSLEKVRVQNPRIKGLLGCIRRLEPATESNFALLNCSPHRLLEIWQQVQAAVAALRIEVAPLLAEPSVIPRLEVARAAAELGLRALDQTVLGALDAFPGEPPPDRRDELRQALIRSIGELHTYLLDTFGVLVAADPRSQHNADYYLSRRFARDLEESQWLFDRVRELEGYLRSLDRQRTEALVALARAMQSEGVLPQRPRWEAIVELLDELKATVTSRLKETITLRGIRLDELRLLEFYVGELPARCDLLVTLFETGWVAIERIQPLADDEVSANQCERDRLACHSALCERLVEELDATDELLHGLIAFVVFWRQAIAQRRALPFGFEGRDEAATGAEAEGADDAEASAEMA
jgi:hypothetical protein